MDAIFWHENFRNEIILKRTAGHSDSKTMGAVHDVILHYPKSDSMKYNAQYVPYDQNYIEQ